MTANVENMVSVREVPWHGIGTIVEEKLTAKDALVLAGLDWEVDLAPVKAQITTRQELVINPVTNEPEMQRVEMGEPIEIEVPDVLAVVRDSDLSVLGTVGSRYQPVQNWKSFEFFDSVVATGDAKYETAGSLAGGRRVFLTARIPREIKIGGADAVDSYLLMANSHDGSMAFTAAVTPVRVVCQNTLNLALRGTKQQWKLRHTDSIDGKIAEARDALGLTFAYLDSFEQEMERLLAQDFSKGDFERLIKEAFPDPVNTDPHAPRFSDEQYAMIGLLESSPTIDDGIRYTKYGALNAIREYDDWGRTYRKSKVKTIDEQRTEATWFGKNVARSNKALALLSA